MNPCAHPMIAAAEPLPQVRWGWVVGLLLTLGALAPRVGYMARPFESDSGLYVYMGQVLAEGGVIYRDFYETKPPGVPLMTAGLYRLFGNAWAPYVALQVVLAVAGAWILSRIAAESVPQDASERGWQFARRVKPRARNHASIGTFFFAMVFLNLSPLAYRGFQLETLTTGIACLGAWFGVRTMRQGGDVSSRWLNAVCCGLFAGAAAMIKPTAGAVFGAMVLTVLAVRQHDSTNKAARLPVLGSIFPGTIGLLLAPALALVWCVRNGVVQYLPEVFDEIARYGSETPLVPLDLFKPAIAAGIISVPFVIVWWVFCRRSEPTRISAQRAVVLFAVFWLLLEAVGVYLQKRMYMYHFLPVIPPVALLFGLLCAKCGRITAPRLAAALGPIVLLSLHHSAGDFQKIHEGGDFLLPESRWLIAHAQPGDTVVGDPIERLLMETGLPCGARYAHLFYFANHDAAPDEYGRKFLHDLDRNRPAWAVFDAQRVQTRQWQVESLSMFRCRPERADRHLGMGRQIDHYLQRHYRAVATVGGKTIFKRIDARS